MEKNIRFLNRFANHLADEARKISLFYFKKKIKINNKNKNNFDPVTAADIGVQKKINSLINKQFHNNSLSINGQTDIQIIASSLSLLVLQNIINPRLRCTDSLRKQP